MALARRAVAVLLLAAVSLAAQTYREQVTVSLVEVPVYLDSLTGAPVTGLTKGDFELSVNGRRQTIHSFDVLDEKAAADSHAGSPADLQRRRLVVLLFDLGGSSYAGIRNGQIRAATYLDRAPSTDVFAVATVGASGIRFIVPFTRDRVAVRRAIATLKASEARDPFQIGTLAVERRAWDTVPSGLDGAVVGSVSDLWESGGWAGLGASQTARGQAEVVREMKKIEQIEQEQRKKAMIRQLGALADRLAPLTGIKEVIFLSEGGMSDAELWPPLDLTQELTRMHATYRAAGAILDAVDLAGMRAPFHSPADRGPDRPARHAAPSILYHLALGTGGTVKPSLLALQKSQTVTYVLTFRPEGPQRATNSIRVRVKNAPPFTIVRHRPSYAMKTDVAAPDALFLADVIMNDIPQNGVNVDVAVTRRGARSEVAAMIPGRELIAHADGRPLLLDTWVYVFDERDLVAGWSHARLAIDAEKGRDYLAANPFTFRKEFDLRPGSYRAKVLVRIAGTDSVGFDGAEVVIP